MCDAEMELEQPPRPPYIRPGALVGAVAPEATGGPTPQGSPPPGASLPGPPPRPSPDICETFKSQSLYL